MKFFVIKLISLTLALEASALAADSVALDVSEILKAAVPVTVDDSTADWRPLHYQIYATSKGEPMSVAEMRQSIDHLRAIYEQQVGTIMADKTMSTRRDKLKAIADSSNFTGHGADLNCQEKMNEINELIRKNQPFQVNLVPYLKQNKRRLFGLCGDEFYGQAEEAVSRLTSIDEAQIGSDFLGAFVTQPSLEELTDEHKLAARVNELLEARKQISKDEAAKRVGDDTYELYYDQLVGSSCEPFKTNLRELIVDKHHLLDFGLDLFEANKRLSKWLRYTQVCMSLINDKKKIMGRSRLVFQDKHMPSGGVIRGRR